MFRSIVLPVIVVVPETAHAAADRAVLPSMVESVTVSVPEPPQMPPPYRA